MMKSVRDTSLWAGVVNLLGRRPNMAMPDYDKNPKSTGAASRDAAELGLASLIMGAALFLAAPITMVLAVLVWQFADDTAEVVLLHSWLARIGVLIGLAVGIASMMLGVSGIRSARNSGRCNWSSMAGLLLGWAATSAWIIASIGLLNTTESLLRMHGP